ncbi:MAG: hypothetical protein C0412_08775 [Flavobacterium sp.]|nr:hypothetical protein [Flavobacterium sp.]
MKSYAVSPIEFARIANECYKAGADTVYLVDSAGGMLPEDVKSFISEAKSKTPQISLGFHGHDNLGLAIINTLTAIECGADIVDSSIRGMGRSSGNTVTEKLIFVLKRMRFDMPYDINKLLELSDNVILEYLSGKPEKTLDMIYGFSQFHSSFIGVIKKYSEIYNIDPKELIIEYTKIDKFNIDEDITNKLAESISKKEKQVYHFKIENKVVKKSDPDEQIDVLLHELYEQKHKFNKKAFFNISRTYENTEGKISPVIHSYENISFASAEVKDSSEVRIIIDKFKDSIDGFLIDERIGERKWDYLNKSFYYDDSKLFAKSIFNHICAIIIDKNLIIRKVYIDERDEISREFIKTYSEKFILVDNLKDADLAVLGRNYYSQGLFKSAISLKWVIINKPGIIESDISSKIDNINFIRIDLSREIFTEIIERMNYSILINKEYGAKQIKNEIYCSGGYVGVKGSVVVDNINNVRQKFGISNGDGSVIYF